jgi:sirohydrochlorin cobaltochelatase
MKTLQPNVIGIILFAHGSRDPLWSRPIEAIAKAVAKQSPNALVRCAYLELMQPSLEVVVREILAAASVQLIRIAPMFLGVGVHARQDLPMLVADLRATYPALTFELMPSIGENQQVMAAIAQALS